MKQIALGMIALFCISGVAEAEPIKIGVITELTGAGAAIGQECQRGAEVALESLAPGGELNGFSLSMKMGDSRDDAKAAIAEFKKLTQADDVNVVVVSRSKIALPLNPLSKRSGIPIVGVVAHPDFVSGNPYAVRVYPNAGVEGSYLAERAIEHGSKKIAVVTVEDEWNLSSSKAFVERFSKLGGTVVFDDSLAPQENDFSPVVTSIKRLSPDAVFMNLQLAQGGSFIKKLREQGVVAQLYSNYWIQKPEMVEVAGVSNVEDAMFGEVDSERPKFRAAFQKKFPGKIATPGTYTCYVGVGSIIYALRNAEKGKRESFVRELTTMEQVELLDDSIPFSGREIQYDLRLRALKGGKVTDVEI